MPPKGDPDIDRLAEAIRAAINSDDVIIFNKQQASALAILAEIPVEKLRAAAALPHELLTELSVLSVDRILELQPDHHPYATRAVGTYRVWEGRVETGAWLWRVSGRIAIFIAMALGIYNAVKGGSFAELIEALRKAI